MKPNQKPDNDEHLRGVLREWVVDAPLPPHFQEQVWQRIARAETRSALTAGAWLWRLVEVVLPRPGFAFAYLSVLLVFGVAAGSVAAQIKTSRLNSELSLRYVQLIDPYRADRSSP
jgi:hypothetical protein